ncbi:hypothetical protein [Sphingobacterium chungjuense]|uniref:hypothetical protein n=1 Tax=Sphingobacterium chungjuense TaxID=2675553 RepID=UPI00140D436D|nr:hypothetical protein [Sphingobacterium chungjuense]
MRYLLIFIPILIVVLVDMTDNFSGWKLFRVALDRDVRTAKITENEYLEMSRGEKFRYDDNDFNDIKFREYLISKRLESKKLLKYSYFSKGSYHSDSLSYYSDEIGWRSDLQDFVQTIRRKPVGFTFEVYAYGDQSLPRYVLENNKWSLLFNDVIKLYILSLIISVVIGVSIRSRE